MRCRSNPRASARRLPNACFALLLGALLMLEPVGVILAAEEPGSGAMS